MSNVVTEMAQALTERAASIDENRRYLSGRQPLAYMSKVARDATKMGRMATNLPRLQVTALAERLRVTDLSVDGVRDRALWGAYRANDLDQRLPVAFREALGLGSSYAIVWDSTGRAEPKVSIESASNVVIETDPGTGETVRAFKRWTARNTSFGVLYEPDVVRRFESSSAGATVGWREQSSIPNPLGVVPVVEFRNSDWLGGPGVSEIEDMKPLVDALNKILADMMVGSEYYARPRRWATGVEMGTDDEGNPVNPFPEGDRMMIAEDVQARFGSLPASDLGSYEAAVKIIVGQIMAVSALPAHYLGSLTGQVPGADGLRAAEASLSARAESKQHQFGRSVEAVGRLMEGIRREVDPDSVAVRVHWADPATRSVAQEADATVKLHAAGLLPTDYALAKLGYDADQIRDIRLARRAEAADRLVLQPRQVTQE